MVTAAASKSSEELWMQSSVKYRQQMVSHQMSSQGLHPNLLLQRHHSLCQSLLHHSLCLSLLHRRLCQSLLHRSLCHSLCQMLQSLSQRMVMAMVNLLLLLGQLGSSRSLLLGSLRKTLRLCSLKRGQSWQSSATQTATTSSHHELPCCWSKMLCWSSKRNLRFHFNSKLGRTAGQLCGMDRCKILKGTMCFNNPQPGCKSTAHMSSRNWCSSLRVESTRCTS